MNPYEAVGVDANAGDDEIIKAYRDRAKKCHPDRNNSPDAEAEFKILVEAYQILINPLKRLEYDQTGTVHEDSPESRALEALIMVLVETIYDTKNLKQENIINATEDKIMEKIAGIETEIRDCRKRIKKLERAVDRLQHKGSSPDLIKIHLNDNIAALRNKIKMHEVKIKEGELMIDILCDYSYRLDVWMPDDDDEVDAYLQRAAERGLWG